MMKDTEYKLDNILRIHLNSNTARSGNSQNELEVRFGTKGKKISKNDFNNVIKRLKSLGFTSNNYNGDYILKIQNQFTDIKTGRTKLSNMRCELTGQSLIQQYCKSGRIFDVVSSLNFMIKSNVKDDKTKETIFPIDIQPYNLRYSYQNENNLTRSSPMVKQTLSDWDNSKKSFRFINRISLRNDAYPVRIDLSIVKSTFTGYKNELFYNIKDSNIFSNNENYEIEIELLNNMIGLNTPYNTVESITSVIKKNIMFILSGIQNSNYPISNEIKNSVLNEYSILTTGSKQQKYNPRNFIGPSSYTLELKNIQPLDKETITPSILGNYTVTDKADGERKLLYISDKGKLYFITTNMEVEFTGLISTNKKLFDSLLDGEHIIHNKKEEYINLYTSFDIYYINKKSQRENVFATTDPKNLDNRLNMLNSFITELNMDIKSVTGNMPVFSIRPKVFYLGNKTKNIFAGCNNILQKHNDGLFEYETDGLIFTPSDFGVGGNAIGESCKPVKTTWEHSFKWKPPEYNTVDFLISIKTDANNQHVISNIFKGGTDMKSINQLVQYKTLVLRCGFDETKHGFLNPCNNVLNDEIPDKGEQDNYNRYKPVAFYPTNPYDNTAHLCNMIINVDKGGVQQITCENGDVIEDNMIIEFRYDITKKGLFKWIPIRCRYDKTNELRSGQKNYGNAYHVANSNWHSIHNPVTLEMISTGENISEDINDIYYNKSTNKTITQALRDFHNLVVKKTLILMTAKPGDSLIDYSVGKAGDIPKWSNAKLDFVLGIDISKDNLEHKIDGACSRYIKMRQNKSRLFSALFLQGNTSQNIKNGDAFYTEKDKDIINLVMGETPKTSNYGKGVEKVYGFGKDGFDVSSCQFSLHYFCENMQTFQGFLRNVSENTKLNGYFIGTCYDGNLIFNSLKSKQKGDSCCLIKEGDTKIWEIIKKYSHTSFEPNSTSLGYPVSVYQESINKYFTEYLVNFDYLVRSMENYGFIPLAKDELTEMGLSESIGNFKTFYNHAENNAHRDKSYARSIGQALKMNKEEKYISFFNKYFIFKKVRNVSAEQIKLGESDQSQFEQQLNVVDESKLTIKITKPAEKKKKRKKLKLVAE